VGWGARFIARLVVAGLLAAPLAGCGGEDEEGFGDQEIVKALKLEKAEEGQGYTLAGNPFCVLSDRFFRGSTEVEAASEDPDVGIIVASREGNVAVEGIPTFFGSDCKQEARQRLDKLDPPAEGE